MRLILITVGTFLAIHAFFFLFLGTSFALNSETKVWQTTDSSGDPDIADPIVSKNVYIDPTYAGSPRDGSISQPYNNASEIPGAWIVSPANKTYLFKRGTTHYGSINFSNHENINIGAYGEGPRPKLIYTGDGYAVASTFYENPIVQQASSTRIVGLDISATKNADALIRLSSNTTVENCYLHNAQWGIRSTGAPIGDPSNIQNVKIINSVIEDIADDGIMLQDVNGILIEDNLIRTVNQNYYLVGPTQQQAAGDGIQFVANANWQIINNKIDRSDTANKFNFITSYDKAIPPNIAIIAGNTFISPMASDQGGAIFYGGYDVGRGYQNTGDGYSVYMINNIFSGALSDTALSSVWYHGENLYSIGNVYKSMTSCLTNRWFKSGISQVPIYSYGDEFLSCANSTVGNVIITNENNIPILSTPYISSGTMGVRGITGFYRGTIDIKADVFDTLGISGTSCEYSIGGSRLPASYSGTTTTGYCYQTDIAGGSDLNITFKVKNLSSDEGLGISRYFVYDTTPPTFTFANISGPECQTGTMSITSPYDIGGLHAIPYSFNGIDWTGATTISIPEQQPGIQIKTGWVRDIPRTQSYQTAIYTFTNVVPTANNFTGDTNVGISTKTANWKIASNVVEGSCGNENISYSGIIVQGNKGICSVTGDIITYTPDDNNSGTDSCTIQIKDNENSTHNIVVYREGIDTAENDY
ncbi:MAG TPA: right-handed parallel beta-helix repeat-containing protein, partial [Candidatus Absconditabacterales bacterium]|nr:right-handed parallel beta-helix repeat-containing protein [Candidatus Absconditabacterales bacterium]